MANRTFELKLDVGKLKAHEIPSVAEMKNALAVSEYAKINQRINDILKLLWIPNDASEEVLQARALRALELYESLEPSDGAEGMLAMQMVGTHEAALDCLRRAAIPEQTFEGRDLTLKHAQKLMMLYTKQLETLNKHRGKGQQKVTVEHVNVEAGGQAIVGNVEAGRRGKQQTDVERVIEDQQEIPFADRGHKPKVPRKRR